MAAECICSIPDSFNVRMSDLRNPRCPIHGVPVADSDKATAEEIRKCIEENLKEVDLGHWVYLLDHPFGPNDIARALLRRFDIRRK